MPGLRALKTQLQREQLIDAGLALFFENGFEGTSVTDITDSIGISQRTFFRYFKTKEELAFDWINANGDFAVEVLSRQPAGQSPIESMSAMHRQLAMRMDDNLQFSARVTRLIFESPTLAARAHFEFAKWEHLFVDLLTRGEKVSAETRRKVEVAVAVNITAFVVAARQWSRLRRPTRILPLVEAALDVI